MARVEVFGKPARLLPRFSAPAPRLVVAKAAHPVPLVAGLLKMKFNAGAYLRRYYARPAYTCAVWEEKDDWKGLDAGSDDRMDF